tara:strand:- start:40 stop:357 length:318 start_codon:yes stop_codon:yes gene_type:complete
MIPFIRIPVLGVTYQVASDDMNDESLETYIAQWRESGEPFDEWFKACDGYDVGGIQHDCETFMPEVDMTIVDEGEMCESCVEAAIEISNDDAMWSPADIRTCMMG